MEHLPPPPYSETDTGTAVLTPSTSQADNSSRPARSTASSAADDEVVFTPPYTPTEVGYHTLDNDLDHISSSSALAYFESRPAIGRAGPVPTVYKIIIASNSKPKDVPYPEPPLNDVTEQDWATFVNYLFPDHAASVNGEVADRKLEAEIAGLGLGSQGLSQADLLGVEAQLEPLRPRSERLDGPRVAEQPTERLHKIDATVTEWNSGFFEPRGIQLRFIEPETRIEDETRTMPGVWVPYDHEILSETQGDEARSPQRSFSFLPGIEASSRGFRFGPVRADSESFRIGKNGLVADGRGFRIGNMLVSDENGFRLGGSRGFVADSNGVTLRGRNFGRRDDRDRCSEHGRGRRRGRHGHHGHRGREGPDDRGRQRGGRSSSASSSSSSSSFCSSISSGSDLSVGSLPDYDDLKDQQLPVAKQSLLDWLNHPEQPITRETVRIIKEEIQVAKKFKPRQFEEDMKALRSDVKSLMKEFKDTKRAQKIFRKQIRKERRIARMAQKKERRAERREERRRRNGKFKEESHAPGDYAPAVPGVGPMVAMHSLPARPLLPIAPGARAAFGSRGSFGGRGSWGKGLPFGRSANGHRGMAAIHGGWPFARGFPVLGCPTSEHGNLGGPISRSASDIYQHAEHLDADAGKKEAEALKLRAEATGRKVNEKEKLKKIDEAVNLEEEAEEYRREADRLRAEAAHLDGELARGMEEDQASGIIQH